MTKNIRLKRLTFKNFLSFLLIFFVVYFVKTVIIAISSHSYVSGSNDNIYTTNLVITMLDLLFSYFLTIFIPFLYLILNTINFKNRLIIFLGISRKQLFWSNLLNYFAYCFLTLLLNFFYLFIFFIISKNKVFVNEYFILNLNLFIYAAFVGVLFYNIFYLYYRMKSRFWAKAILCLIILLHVVAFFVQITLVMFSSAKNKFTFNFNYFSLLILFCSHISVCYNGFYKYINIIYGLISIPPLSYLLYKNFNKLNF
ncbi:hypothetical protein SHELI_v1c04840 [Spiroplasma helicoides]|uniref:Uncharacterized protein n=1 Tax=Spiroplasma helicoides TaxID=216938 RepID=A0A1B3SKK1_9MOLU|nr:hypothetical protein [Spiroplasma helicoides]AOG60435.1 hypothetical protein SHELI_v1c04840 [Spiroplasma helicoides]